MFYMCKIDNEAKDIHVKKFAWCLYMSSCNTKKYPKNLYLVFSIFSFSGVYPSKFKHFGVLPNSKDRASLCGA